MLFRPDSTHIIAFTVGAALMATLFQVDAKLGTEEYVVGESARAERIVENTPTSFTRGTTTDSQEDEEQIAEELPDLTDEELAVVEVLEIEETNVADTSQTEEEVVEALAAAQSALEQLTGQNEDAENGEFFTLPSGVVVDAEGNIVSGGGNQTDTQAEAVNLPDGIFVTPSGAYVDANGNVVDRNGNRIETEEETIFTTTYSTTSPPAVGTTLEIPTSTVLSLSLNPDMTCYGLGKRGGELAVCELYKTNHDDYTWVETNQ